MPLFRPPPPTAATYLLGRIPERTYASKTFLFNLGASQDFGEPARYTYKVFDEPDLAHDVQDDDEVTVTDIDSTPAGRKQIKAQITRTAGNIRQIEIQRIVTKQGVQEVETILRLDREASARLMLFARTLDQIPVVGDEDAIRVEDELLREILANPDSLIGAYRGAQSEFRQLMQADPNAPDVVAIARRREVVERFRQLLTEPDYFEEVRLATPGRSREKVWQLLLEANPWILGVGLTGQLLTSWNSEKLEQTVAGFSVGGPGKVSDAVLRTTGSIRSLVFAEVKHHLTDLLDDKEYRTGCWAPSSELAGGVAQAQQTALLAGRQIGERLPEVGEDGAETGEHAYLLEPRSFLILGNLGQLRGAQGGVHRAKFSSFEVYRRKLIEPEILTFDELLARAEWHVVLAENELKEN